MAGGDVKAACLNGRKKCPYHRHLCKFRGVGGLGKRITIHLGPAAVDATMGH